NLDCLPLSTPDTISLHIPDFIFNFVFVVAPGRASSKSHRKNTAWLHKTATTFHKNHIFVKLARQFTTRML
ncbi:MAG: hypothetical protein ACTTJ7_04085, partial [Treponema sp.]